MKKITHIVSVLALCGMPYCSYRTAAKVNTNDRLNLIWGNSFIAENKSRVADFLFRSSSEGQPITEYKNKSTFLMTRNYKNLESKCSALSAMTDMTKNYFEQVYKNVWLNYSLNNGVFWDFES